MRIYAGIDEAGYGPLFGPLVVACTVLSLPKQGDWNLWAKLAKAICKTPAEARKKGLIPVNDSKKLTHTAAGIAPLETAVLAFDALREHPAEHTPPAHLGHLLTQLGPDADRQDWSALPWYQPTPQHPWQPLPAAADPQQLAIHKNLLRHAAQPQHINTVHLRAAVVPEDRFNDMVRASRSKAAVNFHFVAKHLHHLWQHHGHQHPVVAIDRQSGRTHYRELLAQTFSEDHPHLTVREETNARSSYTLTTQTRKMTLSFEVQAEQQHLPVALASMLAKYTRELMMQRFQHWFQQALPQVAPTAGYGSDAKRFQQHITPLLPPLGLHIQQLRRNA